MTNDQNQNAGIPAASDNLQADLDSANKQIQDLTETAKRALADLQNYRRRVEEEKTAFVQFANAGLLLELLPILDNFNRAFTQVPEEISKTEWFKGALLLEQQLVNIVRKQGVTEIPSSIGKPLDPKIHEAIATGPGEKDTVIEEFEKGYMLGDKVIRPAKVKVGDGNPTPSQDGF
ncbi:nucleotide exchange factor GrpE [Candidatus Peregrinibacteria bacterium]|nr:nucleotide exchange factor GrpE [Candidatus Peregrinibacteria bacterium]